MRLHFLEVSSKITLNSAIIDGFYYYYYFPLASQHSLAHTYFQLCKIYPSEVIAMSAAGLYFILFINKCF